MQPDSAARFGAQRQGAGRDYCAAPENEFKAGDVWLRRGSGGGAGRGRGRESDPEWWRELEPGNEARD